MDVGILGRCFYFIYFESGNSLDARSSKRYYKAISNFVIQNNEKIYAIYDATVTEIANKDLLFVQQEYMVVTVVNG